MTRSHNTYKTWQETKLSNTQNDNAHNANGNTIRKEKIGEDTQEPRSVGVRVHFTGKTLLNEHKNVNSANEAW